VSSEKLIFYVCMKLIQGKFYFSILFYPSGCPIFNEAEDMNYVISRYCEDLIEGLSRNF